MKKVLLIIAVIVLLAAVIGGTVYHSRSNVTPVVTARITREDLTATVTGTGQIKPKTYVNTGA